MPRALSELEQQAVAKFLPTVEFDGLAVVENTEARGLVDPEYVVKLAAFENADKQAVRGVNHAIVCSLLWIARLDEAEARREEREPEFAHQLYDSQNMKYSSGVHVLNHALTANDLTELRNQETETRDFRHHADKIGRALMEAATSDLAVRYENITTPTGATIRAPRFQEEVVVVPIMRAGLSIIPGAMEYLSKSGFGMAGWKRNEDTAEAEKYYLKLPEINENTVILVTDPMLATAGTATEVIREIYHTLGDKQPRAIRFVGVVAAPEGIATLQNEFPDVEIWVGAVDSHLNQKAYIVPGLGDYGDRYFGT